MLILHFSSAAKVELSICERCSVKIFFTFLKVLSGAAFELGIVSRAFARPLSFVNIAVPVDWMLSLPIFIHMSSVDPAVGS